MAKTVNKAERPMLISMICILGFFGVLLTIYWMVTTPADLFGAWYKPYLAASAFLRLIFLTGIWIMRKWGANGYAVFAILNVAFLAYMGAEFVFELIISGVVIFILLGYYSRMK